eukprot:5369172-Amphidinium_carterae.1
MGARGVGLCKAACEVSRPQTRAQKKSTSSREAVSVHGSPWSSKPLGGTVRFVPWWALPTHSRRSPKEVLNDANTV